MYAVIAFLLLQLSYFKMSEKWKLAPSVLHLLYHT